MTQRAAREMTPGDIRIAIMTCKRKPETLHFTLANLFMSGPEIYDVGSIDVLVDSMDRSIGDEYTQFQSVRFHYLSESEEVAEESRAPGARFCYNYWRCLALPSEQYRAIVVLEDDLLVREGFVSCLTTALSEMEDRELSYWVLSLNAKSYLFDDPTLRRGRYFVSYCPYSHGTQAMVFGRDAWPLARYHLRRHGWDLDDAPRLPGDLLLGELFSDLWVRHGAEGGGIYNTVWDLVDHSGWNSTGLGGGDFRSSMTFCHPWEPIEQL